MGMGLVEPPREVWMARYSHQLLKAPHLLGIRRYTRPEREVDTPNWVTGCVDQNFATGPNLSTTNTQHAVIDARTL